MDWNRVKKKKETPKYLWLTNFYKSVSIQRWREQSLTYGAGTSAYQGLDVKQWKLGSCPALH